MPAVCQRVGEFKEAHKYTIMYLLGTVILASSIGTNTVLLCSIGSVVIPLSLCTNLPSCTRRGGVIDLEPPDLMMRRSSRSAPNSRMKEILWSFRSHHQEKARSVQDLLPPVIIHMSWPQGEVERGCLHLPSAFKTQRGSFTSASLWKTLSGLSCKSLSQQVSLSHS